MPDVLLLKSEHWELVVWSKDISYPTNQLTQVLHRRGETLPSSVLVLSPDVVIDEATEQGVNLLLPHSPCSELLLSQPIFFENTHYEFEFTFHSTIDIDGQTLPQIVHNQASVNEHFHYSCRRDIPTLRGHIHFSHNLGWFHLPLRYSHQGQAITQTISFEVWSTNMNMSCNLNRMYLAIDKLYPQWCQMLSEHDDMHEPMKDKLQYSFVWLWLAQFEVLRQRIEKALKLILNAPHSRLVSAGHNVTPAPPVRATPHRSARIRTDIKSGSYHRRYRMAQKTLTVDTAENRFIKMVLITTIEKLASFAQVAKRYNQTGHSIKLSQNFFDQLIVWQQPFEKYRHHALFKEVGEFDGLNKESLVLQQRAGYAQVYRYWHMLSLYLDVLGAQAPMSMKSQAQLYEVWCFIELKQLIQGLGFVEVESPSSRMLGKDPQFRTQQGYCGAYGFVRSDGMHLRLAHEPIFLQDSQLASGWNANRAPDILLEVTFADGHMLYWIFDAKYHFDVNTMCDGMSDELLTRVRHFKALLSRYYANDKSSTQTSEIGVFTLFPQLFRQQNNLNCDFNPYFNMVTAQGIGAFPFLPKAVVDEEKTVDNAWLRSFITAKFGHFVLGESDILASADHQYDSAFSTLVSKSQISLDDNELCLMATTPEGERQGGYYQQFEQGTAKWFHIKLLTTERDDIEQRVLMNEVRYCAIAATDSAHSEHSVRWLWPVRSVKLTNRAHLTLNQTGKDRSSEELYWLFELGAAKALQQPIRGFIHGQRQIKLTQKHDLDDVQHFDEVVARYPGIADDILDEL